MFPLTYVGCDYCCVIFASFLSTCVTSEISRHTSRRGTLYTYIKMCVFGPSAFFLYSGRGSFLVLSDPWHAGSPPEPRTQAWALAEVRGSCSGSSESHVPSGRHSQHVQPSRCMQTHVLNTLYINRLKKCPMSHLISGIMNCQCRQTLHAWWCKFFPDTMPDMRLFILYCTINLRPIFAK